MDFSVLLSERSMANEEAEGSLTWPCVISSIDNCVRDECQADHHVDGREADA